ncbi:MAG: hypothetical protein MI923_05545 [Phycisphaerales bacterium]|nr:hypothetical protein [Phycisphaerales bacterium]
MNGIDVHVVSAIDQPGDLIQDRSLGNQDGKSCDDEGDFHSRILAGLLRLKTVHIFTSSAGNQAGILLTCPFADAISYGSRPSKAFTVAADRCGRRRSGPAATLSTG